jgi:hypothetical protein
MFSNNGGIPGTKIYTLSSRQLPEKPSSIEVVVDVNTTAKDALKTKLGTAWSEPENLYIWMAIKTDSSYSSYADELHPAMKIALDPSKTHYVAVFDLIANSSGNMSSTGFNWLNAGSLFSEYNTSGKMTGYYLFASDGWSNNSGNGSSYELEGTDPLDTKSFNFYQNFPKGKGLSNYVEFPAPAPATDVWIPIIQGSGSVSANVSKSDVTDADVITVTYKTPNASDDPKLQINNSGNYTHTTTSGTLDSASNLYVYEFKIRFQGNATTVLSDNQVDYLASKGTYYYLTFTGGNLGYWASYRYLGAVTNLAQENFDSSTPLTIATHTDSWYYDYSTYSYKQYSSAGNNWQMGLPDLGDRSTDIETKLISTNNALMVRGFSAGTSGSYDRYRSDYVEIPLGGGSGVTVPSGGGDLLLSFNERSDFADSDYVYVEAVLDSGYTFSLGSIDRWSSTLSSNNSWDTSIVDGWKTFSATQSGVTAGTVISKLRFNFYSDGYWESRGITLDNVKLDIVQ